MTKILVIDDDANVRNSLKDILNTVGFETILATNATEGLLSATQQLPNLIICDIKMPEMDGYQLLQQLQNNQKTNTIPFIFLTGNSHSQSLRKGMELGADDYLIKPFSIDSLINTIKTRLEKTAKQKEKLEQKLAELRRNITLSFPHEINTSLNGIIAPAQLLQQFNSELDQTQLIYLGNIIAESAERLSHLLENFSIYTELELMVNNPEELAKIKQFQFSYHLDSLLKSIAINTAEQYNRASDIQLIFEFNEEENGLFNIPEEKLTKVLSEVIDNSFKYSEIGNYVKIRLVKKDDQVIVFIINQGRGMTIEEIEKIGAYMQFNRRKYEQQGAGLGLIIAQKIMSIYHGNLTVNSIIDQETCIKLTFPIKVLSPLSKDQLINSQFI